MFTMESKVVSQPPVESDDLVQSVDQICISEISCDVPQI
jgi:hypothetical protein